MRDPYDPHDPRGLVRESYRIEGITAPDCRVIFLDWALSLAVDADMNRAIGAMLDKYAQAAPDHPMTATLRAGLAEAALPQRRGGAMGRRAQA